MGPSKVQDVNGTMDHGFDPTTDTSAGVNGIIDLTLNRLKYRV